MEQSQQTNPQEAESKEEQPSQPQIPEGGREQFFNKETGEYNWEAHAKDAAYRMDQLKNSQSNQEENPQSTGDSGEPEVDWDSLGQELISEGKFSDSNVDKLTKMGIPKEIIDDYVSAVASARQQQTHEAVGYFGGAEQWESIQKWAAANLSESEINTYNEGLASPNWKMAADSLIGKFSKATGHTEPSKQHGTGKPDSATVAFASKQQMVDAMNKRDEQGRKMYDIDPAYRDQVRRKVAVSKF